jgi:acetyltransferase-like isoleucine patch superfamily enzyme
LEDTSRPIWKAGLTAKPTVIEDDVFLGCRVVLLGGVLVGGGAVVAAGAVVTSDVRAGAIAAGVPAKVVARRGECPAP